MSATYTSITILAALTATKEAAASVAASTTGIVLSKRILAVSYGRLAAVALRHVPSMVASVLGYEVAARRVACARTKCTAD